MLLRIILHVLLAAVLFFVFALIGTFFTADQETSIYIPVALLAAILISAVHLLAHKSRKSLAPAITNTKKSTKSRKPLPSKFTVINVQTTDEFNVRICDIGIVRIFDGQIVSAAHD